MISRLSPRTSSRLERTKSHLMNHPARPPVRRKAPGRRILMNVIRMPCPLRSRYPGGAEGSSPGHGMRSDTHGARQTAQDRVPRVDSEEHVAEELGWRVARANRARGQVDAGVEPEPSIQAAPSA